MLSAAVRRALTLRLRLLHRKHKSFLKKWVKEHMEESEASIGPLLL